MTTVILVAGVLSLVALAAAMVRPAWRLPALALGLLAMPGNVDDLLPAFVLDPNDVPGRLAPVVSALDALLLWAVVLTLRDGGPLGTTGRRIVGLAIALAAVASLVVAVHLAGGLDPGAGVRGLVLVWRIPALIWLALRLRTALGDGRILAAAITLGGVALLANGVYTTIEDELLRFSARTFGRNGFAIALTTTVVVAAGLAFELLSRGSGNRERLAGIAAAIVAAGCLFGMSATGTRMAFIILVLVAIAALVLYPGRLTARSLPRIVTTGLVATVVLGASVMFTNAGARTVSVVTEPDTTVDVVTDPGNTPTESEIRSRGQFWGLAVDMVRDRPLTGVGPFQWNVERYERDPGSPVILADAHQTYLQLAAEYGLPVAALYGLLLASGALVILWRLWSRSARADLGWAGMGIVLASAVIPLAALTNSHVTNPRNGPLEWLLLGAALALALGPGPGGPGERARTWR